MNLYINYKLYKNKKSYIEIVDNFDNYILFVIFIFVICCRVSNFVKFNDCLCWVLINEKRINYVKRLNYIILGKNN